MQLINPNSNCYLYIDFPCFIMRKKNHSNTCSSWFPRFEILTFYSNKRNQHKWLFFNLIFKNSKSVLLEFNNFKIVKNIKYHFVFCWEFDISDIELNKAFLVIESVFLTGSLPSIILFYSRNFLNP